MIKVCIALILSITTFSKDFSVVFMGAYSNQSIYRGATTWAGPTAMVGPGFIFFDKLKLFGPSLFWGFFDRGDSHGLEIGVRYFDDNKPLIRLDDTKETYRNSRQRSIPISLDYSYKFGDSNFRFGVFLEKEVKEYYGSFLKFKLSAPVIPLVSLVTELSFAEKSTNQYIYGKQARSGDGYLSVGLSNFIPFVPWSGRIINTLTYEVITQSDARHADLVRGDYKNIIFATRWFWDAF